MAGRQAPSVGDRRSEDDWESGGAVSPPVAASPSVVMSDPINLV